MTITTIPARDFARDLRAAKQAAEEGPVFVTDRGRPRYALLKIEDYYKLAGKQEKSLLDVMDEIPGGDFEFELPELKGNGIKPAELD